MLNLYLAIRAGSFSHHAVDRHSLSGYNDLYELASGRHRRERAELAPEHHPGRCLLLRHAPDPASAQEGRQLDHLSAGNAAGFIFVILNLNMKLLYALHPCLWVLSILS